MSKVSITGNDSGTGTFTIAAPNSNNNRTFNLPDEDGVVVTNSTDLEPQVKTSLNATGDAPMFACRAFVNFDGVGTVTIRESGNVSSITDNGTADYTVNFTTAMPDANYAVSGFAAFESSTDNNVYCVGQKGSIANNYTASLCRLQIRRVDTVTSDIHIVTASFFR